MRVESLLKIEDEITFKLHTGLRRHVFFDILAILQKEYDAAHIQGSNKGIGPACRLVIALCYWREYRGMRQMALDFDLALSTVCDSITWVEDTLSKNDKFQIQDIKSEIEKNRCEELEDNYIIGDVTEQQIQIPKENQEEYYSGKKKKHTEKNQIIVIVRGKIKRIVNIFNAKGTMHDFNMIKTSGILEYLKELGVKGLFDSGYQGIQKILTNAIIPYKNTKNHPLTDEQKEFNKALSKQRVEIEHVNREIKKFRIMKDVYRSHRDRYQLRLSIICSIYNLNYGS